MNTIKINAQEKVPVTPGMIGLFFEDINYNLDGGLHAELIENRNFEALQAWGDWDDYHTRYDGMYAWSQWSENATCKLTIGTEAPQNEVNPHYLHVETKSCNEGFANKAYDGIYVQEGKSYTVSFYARTSSYSDEVTVSVCAGNTVAAKASVSITADGSWNLYSLTLTAETTLRHASFVMTLNAPGTVDFDFISMIPEDAVLGLFRRDLAEKLKEIKPGFLRFPGGCIIEGNNLDNRYQWKKSVGPKETRKFNWNRWAVHNTRKEDGYVGPFSHYGQTLGVGYYEYFLLCEYLGAKPLPVMNVGLACQYQSTQQVPMDTPEFQEFIQDALDLIEFANGDVTTTWGALRAEMGHPEPFNMTYIGIGNEQWQTEEVDFFARYEKFEQAIHAVYPDMLLIGSAGPDVISERYTKAWEWIHDRVEKNPDFVYAVDEHYYVAPKWLYDNVHFYDNYPRTAKVFSGEYAAHIPGRAGRFNCPEANSFEAALAEAAFLTGVERNADVVVLASYAPLIARLGSTQWSPDLIWFDDTGCYGTPSYYVQKLYSHYMGNNSLATEAEGTDLYASATYCDKCCKYVIKAVNASSESKKVQITLDAETPVSLNGEYKCLLLTADMDEQNSVAEPEKVSPKEVVLTIENGVAELPAHSFNIIII